MMTIHKLRADLKEAQAQLKASNESVAPLTQERDDLRQQLTKLEMVVGPLRAERDALEKVCQGAGVILLAHCSGFSPPPSPSLPSLILPLASFFSHLAKSPCRSL